MGRYDIRLENHMKKQNTLVSRGTFVLAGALVSTSAMAGLTGEFLFIGVDDSAISSYLVDPNNMSNMTPVNLGVQVWGAAGDDASQTLYVSEGSTLSRWSYGTWSEIGAGTTIDRASVGESRIGRGSKIDNLVQIGHSCTVGEDSLLCAQVGLAGSSHIGSRVILAGQAGVAGHLTIGDDVVLTAKSATSHDIPAGKVISGIPAFDNRDWLRSTAAFRRLGDIQRTVRHLERRMKDADAK